VSFRDVFLALDGKDRFCARPLAFYAILAEDMPNFATRADHQPTGDLAALANL
jgi:hypothetical protein